MAAGRQAAAFCPAHITGFFKAFADGRGGGDRGRRGEDRAGGMQEAGSTGAGFSLAVGVTTRVGLTGARAPAFDTKGTGGGGGPIDTDTTTPPYVITTTGYDTDDTTLSETTIRRFLQAAGRRGTAVPAGSVLDVRHEISVPVGYGLGCSGAVALSLAYALNDALGAGMTREELGGIAHEAEVECRTGLGDVLASYHGGFEVRTRPGAPGVGRVEAIPTGDVTVLVLCMAPISTRRFIAERLPHINGLGGEMIGRLRRSRDYAHFEDMSLEFAEHVGVVTPRMRRVASALRGAGIRCGVALFGETIFCMVEAGGAAEARAEQILRSCGSGHVIKSGIDRRGARPLPGAGW
ncbi:MAG: GHMP kinase [Thaumarchaeota archaeon]|nr:GHMP kinase [Nitrososphaerota archaeon]